MIKSIILTELFDDLHAAPLQNYYSIIISSGPLQSGEQKLIKADSETPVPVSAQGEHSSKLYPAEPWV